MYKKFLFIIFAVSLFLLHSPPVFAAGTVTIVNPLRGPQLGLEKADLAASLKSQWQYTKDASVSATWLWQYSALENEQLTNLAKAEMQNQEHGIFFEIDKNTAEKSEVGYKGRNQWYHSDGLLLISYDLYERHKIIDTTFKKFHDVFGYYPTSVGAWWIGAEPITYMKEKYGINAVLQCADQFNTDAYSIWGTPWSIPYISRKDNAAIPASNAGNSSDVVIQQWAPRDPNRAYGDSVTHSTFSMQDYSVKSYDLRYIQYLQNIFLQKPEDQVVFVLEGGVIPEGYTAYGLQVAKTKQWENEGTLQIRTMKEYAQQFLKSQHTLPPTNYFLTKDYENNDQAFWYNTPYYRLGIQKKGQEITLIDLRDYANTPAEEFNIVPNTQKLLRINTKAIIDSVRLPDQKFKIGDSEQAMRVETQNNTILLKTGDRILATLSDNRVKINDRDYLFQSKQDAEYAHYNSTLWLMLKTEKVNYDLQRLKTTSVASKKNTARALIIAYILLGVLITILVLIHQKNRKLAVTLSLLIIVIIGYQSYRYINTPENTILTTYEAEALTFLNAHHNQIAYLQPMTTVDFRALQPLFYAKPNFAEKMTNRQWKYLQRFEGQPLSAPLESETLLVVPRYLGSEIYPDEPPLLNIKKIFDNGQIAIFQRN